MIELVLFLAIIGFLTWLVVTYIPMPAPLPTVIIVIVVIFVVLYLLRVVGFDMPIPKVR